MDFRRYSSRAAVLYEPAFAVFVRSFDIKWSSALLAVTVVARFAHLPAGLHHPGPGTRGTEP